MMAHQEPITGTSLRTPRAAAAAGIGFSLLLGLALVLLILSAPSDPATEGAWLTDTSQRATVALALARTSCWASRPPSPRAPSTAHVRSGQAPAQATSFPAWSGQAQTRSVPSGSSAPPTATAVCEPLCGSIPIITAITTLPIVTRRPDRLWRACLIPDLRWALAPLSSHATARSDGAGASI